ncbi:unnamed protein product [Parajaminaea phylloscopi]
MTAAQVSEVITLTQKLTQIVSTNTTLSSEPGTGERAVAEFVSSWLTGRGFEIRKVPTADAARPSVLAVKRGSGGEGAKSILFNGHIDTVSVAGYKGDPLSGEIRDGRVWGRGSADMKGGLAAAMVAAANTDGLRGDVWIAAVADEEDASRGSFEVLEVCPDVHGAIFPEPTQENIIVAHRGFAWFNVTVTGRAAHGSLFRTGVDAIGHMGLFLAEFKKYCDELTQGKPDELLEYGSAHAGILSGGEETSSYPASATVTVERRTLPGETDDVVQKELTDILERVKQQTPTFQYDIVKTLSRPPLAPKDGDFYSLVSKTAAKHLQSRGTGKREGGAFWCDGSLFAAKGIESLVLGPVGEGYHTEAEWVDIKSLDTIHDVYVDVLKEFCS